MTKRITYQVRIINEMATAQLRYSEGVTPEDLTVTAYMLIKEIQDLFVNEEDGSSPSFTDILGMMASHFGEVTELDRSSNFDEDDYDDEDEDDDEDYY